MSFIRSLDLHYKLNNEQFDLVWKAMDGYGEYREQLGKTMNPILFIFKRGFKHYLVHSENETDAWNKLCKRQSCGLEIGKKQYKLINIIEDNNIVIKL